MDPIWYLGPTGDLRALTCPETGVGLNVVRFGGSHQGLSGSNTTDITGHRQTFDFSYNYIEEEEYRWLEAMHLRLVRGPFRLINPLKRNRLTPEASFAKLGGGTAQGMTFTLGIGSREWAWPSTISYVGGMSTRWFVRTNTGVWRMDEKKKTTVFPGEEITGSIWMKTALNPVTVPILFDWYDINGTQTSSTQVACNVTNVWTRFSITRTVPVGVSRAVFAGFTTNTTESIDLAAAQLEQGPTATEWQIGGGAPVVNVDQLSNVSPYFPMTNCTLSLLET
jgi:hypothetical protein